MNKLDKVQEFHESFGLTIDSKPDNPDRDLILLRMRLLSEELRELRIALSRGDVVETLDALVDLQYVLLGAVLSFGLKDVFHEAFDIVHESNMSKLDENGKPIYREDGKVLKGPNFVEPDLKQLIKKVYGEEYVNQRRR